MAYSQCEISKQAEVDRLISGVLEKFGKLNGIIHAAGVFRMPGLLKKLRARSNVSSSPRWAAF